MTVERTPEDAYLEHLQSIRRALAEISTAVDQHVLEAGACPHWGHVGDLAQLEEVLVQARKFILNEEE